MNQIDWKHRIILIEKKTKTTRFLKNRRVREVNTKCLFAKPEIWFGKTKLLFDSNLTSRWLLVGKCNRIFEKDVSYLSQLGITCYLKVVARVSLMTMENITKYHQYNISVVWSKDAGEPMARNRFNLNKGIRSFCWESFARADAAFKFNWKVLRRNELSWHENHFWSEIVSIRFGCSDSTLIDSI